MQASQKCTLNFFFYISLISLKMCWEFSIELQLTLLIFSFISLLMYHSFSIVNVSFFFGDCILEAKGVRT